MQLIGKSDSETRKKEGKVRAARAQGKKDRETRRALGVGWSWAGTAAGTDGPGHAALPVTCSSVPGAF